jgi:hypothetical protein
VSCLFSHLVHFTVGNWLFTVSSAFHALQHVWLWTRAAQISMRWNLGKKWDMHIRNGHIQQTQPPHTAKK